MRTAVVLFNLGGPETLGDVRRFLYNLFSDPAILRIRSAFVRKTLAWLIAAVRQGKSRGYYAKIGGGSPLRRITEGQAAALRERLFARGIEADVLVAMQCWRPSIDEAVDRILASGTERAVLLPLYPQFSTTTTGSALERFETVLAERNAGSRLERRVVREWHADPGYVAALAETAREETTRFPDPKPGSVRIVYSAHSIPRRLVDEGDPYLEQTERTVELVDRALGREGERVLAFQSKVGPVQWLEPATQDVLGKLGREGATQVLVVPVSFVSDHIETLYEIDVFYRERAEAAGIAHFRRAPALNVRPAFIDALAGIVERQLSK